MKKKLFTATALLTGLLLSHGLSANTSTSVLPDSVVMPCERPVKVDDITRLVVPMTPFRGVNLIFPFELSDDNTAYSMSSDLVWDFKTAKGTRVVPIYFQSFDSQWGELTDFTISTGDHIFSITLKADPDIRNHCTNIVFEFTDEQLKAIREGERKEHLAALDAEYEQKFDDLEKMAEKKALELVGALSRGGSSDTGIHEYRVLELSNGDEVELYVEEMQGWGTFSLLLAEVSNDSEVSPLYIEDIKVGRINDKEQRIVLDGHAEVSPKLAVDSVGKVTWSTTENIPTTNGFMELTTDRGTVEVTW